MSATPPHELKPADEIDGELALQQAEQEQFGQLQVQQAPEARTMDDRVARLLKLAQECGELADGKVKAMEEITQPELQVQELDMDEAAAAVQKEARFEEEFDAEGEFLQEGPIAEARRRAVELQSRMTAVMSSMEELVAELETADADGELSESDRTTIEPLVKFVKGMAVAQPAIREKIAEDDQKFFACKAAHEAAMATMNMPAPPSHDEVRATCWACRAPRSQGQWPAPAAENTPSSEGAGAEAEAKTTSTGRCSRCKLVFYCSRECQSRDWPIHKKQCCSPAKREENRLKKNRDNTALKNQCEHLEKCMPPGTFSTIALRDSLTIMNKDEWIFETRRKMRKDQVLAAVTGTNVYSFTVDKLGKDWLLRVEDADELHPVLSLWGDDTQWEETRPGLDYRKNGTINAQVDALLQQHRAMTSTSTSSAGAVAAITGAGPGRS